MPSVNQDTRASYVRHHIDTEVIHCNIADHDRLDTGRGEQVLHLVHMMD